MAAPHRQIINLQADGSAMYTLQVCMMGQTTTGWAAACNCPLSFIEPTVHSSIAELRLHASITAVVADMAATSLAGDVDSGKREAAGAHHHTRQQHLRHPAGAPYNHPANLLCTATPQL